MTTGASSHDRDLPKGSLPESAAVGALCLLAALLYMQGTPARLAHAIAPDLGDPVFNLYLLRWGAHQAALGFPSFWDANFFFPAKGVIALSDHLLGPSLAFGALQWFGAPPVLAYNLLVLSSFACGGAILFWIATQSGLTRGAALVASFGYSFGLLRWRELSHLQILLCQWLPLTLWTFDRLLERRSWGRAAAFLGAYSLNALGGTYFAYMVHLGLAAILGVRVATERRRLVTRDALRILLPTGVVAAALSALLFVPYLRLREGLGVEARFIELNDLRLSLLSLLTPNSRLWYAGAAPSGLHGRPELWPGFVPLALLAFALGGPLGRLRESWRALPASRRALAVAAVAACAVAFVAADLGTAELDLTVAGERHVLNRLYKAGGLLFLIGCATLLRLHRVSGLERTRASPWWRSSLWIVVVAGFAAHPVGYFLMRDLLPGFGSLRVATRLTALAAPAFFLAVGVGVDRLRAIVPPHRATLSRSVPLIAIALLALELAPKPGFIVWKPIASEREFPAATRWIAEQDDIVATLELPLLPYWREARRMYVSTLHFVPMVNGYSGYIPPLYGKVVQRLERLPTEDTLVWLRDLGVTHIVVHLDEYPAGQRRAVERWRLSAMRFEPVLLRTVYEARETIVLKIESGSVDASVAPAGSAAGLN